MTDLELVEAATNAGLCVAQCWDLSELLNADDAETSENFIKNAETQEEREIRQRNVNHMRVRAQEKLEALRKFAALILLDQYRNNK